MNTDPDPEPEPDPDEEPPWGGGDELTALRRQVVVTGTAAYIAARKAGDQATAARVADEMASVGWHRMSPQCPGRGVPEPVPGAQPIRGS